jgi:hypothetical protein
MNKKVARYVGTPRPELSETEICMLIPASFATGECDDPLSMQVIALIYAMAECRYCPYAFGEGDDCSQELWFQTCPSIHDARIQANHFIVKKGDL